MQKLMGDEGWGGGPCFSLLTPSVCVRKLMQCEMTELFVAQVTSRELLLRKPRKYITRLLSLQIPNSGKRIPRLCIITSVYLDKYQFQLSAHDIYTV